MASCVCGARRSRSCSPCDWGAAGGESKRGVRNGSGARKEDDDPCRLLKQNVSAKQLASCSTLRTGWGRRSWASDLENTQQLVQSSETKASQGRSWPPRCAFQTTSFIPYFIRWKPAVSCPTCSINVHNSRWVEHLLQVSAPNSTLNM